MVLTRRISLRIQVVSFLYALLSFCVAHGSVIDSNPIYGYEAFLVKKNHQRVINLQDIDMYYFVTRPLSIQALDLATNVPRTIDSAKGDADLLLERPPAFSKIKLKEGMILRVLDVRADMTKIGIITSYDDQVTQVSSHWIYSKSLWKSRIIKIGTSLAFLDEMNGEEVSIPMALKASVLAENQERIRRGERVVLSCYRRVKEYLLRRNLVDRYLPGKSAKIGC